jgi:hypothetical protein
MRIEPSLDANRSIKYPDLDRESISTSQRNEGRRQPTRHAENL